MTKSPVVLKYICCDDSMGIVRDIWTEMQTKNNLSGTNDPRVLCLRIWRSQSQREQVGYYDSSLLDINLLSRHDKNKKDTDILLLVQDDITKWHGRTKHTENNIFSPECIRIFRVASRCVRRVWDIWDQYANRKCKQEQVTQHCFLRNLEVQIARTATELLWSSHPNHPFPKPSKACQPQRSQSECNHGQ